MLALVDIAKKHGASLPVWRAIDRLRIPRRVVLAEYGTYGKNTRITREVSCGLRTNDLQYLTVRNRHP